MREETDYAGLERSDRKLLMRIMMRRTICWGSGTFHYFETDEMVPGIRDPVGWFPRVPSGGCTVAFGGF